MTKKHKGSEKDLEDVLETLSDIEGIEAAIITTDNGEIISSGDALFAQVSARRMAMEEGASADFGDEPPDDIIITSKSKRITVMRVNSELLVAVCAKPEANQGLISSEILRAATAVKELMKRKKKA